MKRKLTYIFLIGGLVLCGVTISRYVFIKPQFKTIVVFGDSLSDQGNVFAHSENKFPLAPYYEGRFTNGKVWVEHLAELMGINDLKPSLLGGTNYAYGGARTGGGFRRDKPNMGEQIRAYLKKHKRAKSDNLYIVSGGGNDFLGGTFIYTIENIENHIKTLAEAGGKYFLVSNFAPLGHAPVFTHEIPILLEESIVDAVDTQLEKYLDEKFGVLLAKACKSFIPTLRSSMPQIKEYLPQLAEELSKRVADYMEDDNPLTIDEINSIAFTSANAFSKMFNDHLSRVLNDLEKTYGITIYRLDVHDIIETVANNPDSYGIKEAYSPVLDPKTHELPDGAIPDDHLFFDGIHPTHATHKIIAEAAFGIVEKRLHNSGVAGRLPNSK